MQSSSLVLVAIIGVWAAYLVPHWLRRRDELAQSRTPDRFSSRMRVLQRRAHGSRHSGHPGHSGRPLLSSPSPTGAADDVEPATGPAPAFAAALAGARAAARRRALILLGLFALTVGAGVSIPALARPGWVVAPSGALLVLHLMASRAAGIRSREHLAVLAEQARAMPAAAVAVARPVARPEAPAVRPAAAARVPARPARRSAAAGGATWDPIPVPAPTYTLKPAVFRPDPPPLDVPAAASASAVARVAAGSARSRGSLPRRADEIERILALDSDPLRLRTAVNG